MLNNIGFASPYFFLLLLIIPLITYFHFRLLNKRIAGLKLSNNIFFNQKTSLKVRLRNIPFYLRMLVLFFIIIALARPQKYLEGENIYSEGINIALVFDISSSMLAQDFSPNRLEAAKDVIGKFISKRVSDRIGLVIFSRDAFTQCPLTVDYEILKGFLGDVKNGMIEDGTAIGNALANGINRLKDVEGKSKVIILLTDGVNNAGEVNPITAAEIAQSFNIKVYTIGVGTTGEALYPVNTPFGTTFQKVPVEIDEALLKRISFLTGGKYFRAVDDESLNNIYSEIDKLEKSKVEVTSYRTAKELFYYFVWTALLFFIIELLFEHLYLRRLP